MNDEASKARRYEAKASLSDMAHSIDAIETYTQGMTAATFETDAKTVDAVVRRFEVLGEAANRLLRLAKTEPGAWHDLPLRDVVDMRNVLIHGYDAVDTGVLWRTFQTALPELETRIEGLLGDAEP